MSPTFKDLEGNIVEKPKGRGLYVKALNGETVSIDIPEDCCAI